jgi:hypothetical protein
MAPKTFAPRFSPQERAERERARNARHLARLAAREQREEADREAAADRVKMLALVLHEEGASAAFMKDPTLRNGDIVVTQWGIRIFHGAVGADHVESDFTPVEQSAGPNRANLMALERASGLNLASGLNPEGANKVAIAAPPPRLNVAESRHRHRHRVAEAVRSRGDILLPYPANLPVQQLRWQ